MKQQISLRQLAPVLAGFFVMGFIDLVGIASNYVKQDFGLSDTTANLPLMLVFVWFFVLSVPIGLLMDRIGRKRTVLISMYITAIALILPFLFYSFYMVMLAFSLLGIGNTILQVSANPLLAAIVPEERMASSLTFGQFVKAVASFLGPVVAGFMAWYFGDWKLIFLAFALASLGVTLWLYLTALEEDPVYQAKATLGDCVLLLKDRFMFGLFIGIVLVVGIDVGLNTTLPKFLMARIELPLEQAGLASSLYFISRMTGTFFGAVLLMKVPLSRFYLYTSVLATGALVATMFAGSLVTILIGIFLTGLGVANIFSVIFSIALLKRPGRKNEISGLMMMGIVGGALVPPVMGLFSDLYGQSAAMLVLLACLFYILIKAVSFSRMLSQ